MGTLDVGAIRTGMAARLQTIANFRIYETLEGQIEPPAAAIYPDNGAYDSTMGRGSDEAIFIISLAVSGAVDRPAQNVLDGYLSGSGASSIKVAMDAETTLGGVVSFARVRGWRNYGSTTSSNGVKMWGADFVVEVRT